MFWRALHYNFLIVRFFSFLHVAFRPLTLNLMTTNPTVQKIRPVLRDTCGIHEISKGGSLLAPATLPEKISLIFLNIRHVAQVSV